MRQILALSANDWTNLWQAIAIAIMLWTIGETRRAADLQIAEMRKEERDKRLIAKMALAEEMKHNRSLLEAYISHCQDGAHLTQGTYELIKPKTGAYDKYLFPVCADRVDLAREITQLYLQLESCGVLIQGIHDFVANNLLQGGSLLLQNAIVNRNKQLLDISGKARERLNVLIPRLEVMNK